MEITICFTKSEEDTLNALIDLSISFGLKHDLFTTGDEKFLDAHRYTIQKAFKNNGILDWYPEGCGQVKFKFTNLGLAVIQNYRPEVIEKNETFSSISLPSC